MKAIKPTLTRYARPLHFYLAQQIKRSGLTNREIGQACGFMPNMVSMIKKGHTRLPLERLGALQLTQGPKDRCF